MKKVLAIFVLFSHINFTMFIPQVDEVDTYNAAGQQNDDINSLYEFVDEVILCNNTVSLEDTDDDTARYFTLDKLNSSVFWEVAVESNQVNYRFSTNTSYPSFITPGLPTYKADIQTPPPEA